MNIINKNDVEVNLNELKNILIHNNYYEKYKLIFDQNLIEKII